MTSHGESAVLVLAAGAGTRMRSDTPKVLHSLAGRSMLAHSLHAITKMAPQHLVVVLGQDHQRIEQAIGELAGRLGRSIDVAIQDHQLGTGHAVLCGLSALPDDFRGVVVVTSGDIPLLDADTLADLVAAHSSRGAAVTVLTTTLSDPTGYGRTLRTQDHQV
ncbi:MAG: NTP transferase domain-containing protein, partial [Mycobacterium sp.]